MKLDVISLEKKVITVAILASACHLALIFFAVFKLGITVPGCVPNPKEFSKAEIIKHGDLRYELRMISRMWNFEPKVIRLPVGSQLEIFMQSKDVNHGFQIVGTNVNVMAIPGVLAQTSVTFRKPGSYRIVCNEYCGAGHQDMNGIIEVDASITEAEIRDGYKPIDRFAFNVDEHPGKATMEKHGCTACHSLDGSTLVGPTLKAIFGKRVELDDGSKVKVDEAYLISSIVEPNKQLVKGFAALMPKTSLTEEELTQILELIKGIK